MSRPEAKRVAIIGNQPFTVARFRSLLIRDLTARGHRVFALSPGWATDPESRAIVEAAGARTVDIEMDRTTGGVATQLRSIWSIRRRLAGLKVDATFAYFVKPVVFTSIASTGLGVSRKVAMIEGLGYTGADEARGLLPRVVKQLYRVATAAHDAFFVMNDEDRDYFLHEIGIAPAKVHRLEGMGIDVEELAYRPPVVGPFTFLFVARMLKQKGVWEFVEAARRVRAARPGVRFVMLGGVDDSLDAVPGEELRTRTAEAGVEWPGHVSNVHDFLRDAHAFVLPSYYREGYPRSIMEAMAVGRAVITTDNPGCRDAVEDGVTGLMVPPRDVDALVEAMLALVDDPARATAMGVRGRERAEQRYDYRAINDRVIRQLVGDERASNGAPRSAPRGHAPEPAAVS